MTELRLGWISGVRHSPCRAPPPGNPERAVPHPQRNPPVKRNLRSWLPHSWLRPAAMSVLAAATLGTAVVAPIAVANASPPSGYADVSYSGEVPWANML